jgi:dTDP-4-dehydrorhamnose 3,5-epimerase-like enzyme
MENLPEILRGGLAIDDRGTLAYLNTAPLEKTVRLYAVENFSTDTIRAFHGHKIEEKILFVASGSAIVVLAPMNEDKLEHYTRYTLSGRSPSLLRIPAGYANGFRALEPNTKLLFFSSVTLEQAKTDDYRFPYDYFGKEIWEVESR